MRKTLTTISLLAMTGFFFASCNKTADWTCTCEKDGEIVFKSQAYDVKKKGEKEACDKMEQEINGATCKLTKK